MTKHVYIPIKQDFDIEGQSGTYGTTSTQGKFYSNSQGYCYVNMNNNRPYAIDITANTADAKKITLQTNEYFSKISSDHNIGFVNETASLSAYPDEYHTFDGYTITGGTLTSNQFKITQDTIVRANFSLKNNVNFFSASGTLGNINVSGSSKAPSAVNFLWLSASANVPSTWTTSVLNTATIMFPINEAKNLMIKVNYDISANKLNDSAKQDPWLDPYLTNKFKTGWSNYTYSGFDYYSNYDYLYLPLNDMPFTSHFDISYYIENPFSSYRLVNSLEKFESGNNVIVKVYNATWTATGIRL